MKFLRGGGKEAKFHNLTTKSAIFSFLRNLLFYHSVSVSETPQPPSGLGPASN